MDPTSLHQPKFDLELDPIGLHELGSTLKLDPTSLHQPKFDLELDPIGLHELGSTLKLDPTSLMCFLLGLGNRFRYGLPSIRFRVSSSWFFSF
jgi:hypothetical protein